MSWHVPLKTERERTSVNTGCRRVQRSCQIKYEIFSAHIHILEATDLSEFYDSLKIDQKICYKLQNRENVFQAAFNARWIRTHLWSRGQAHRRQRKIEVTPTSVCFLRIPDKMMKPENSFLARCTANLKTFLQLARESNNTVVSSNDDIHRKLLRWFCTLMKDWSPQSRY